MKKIFLIIFVLFLTISCVHAGNNTTDYPSEYVINNNDFEIVESLEDGHFNISFNNSYKGYCLEYGEKDANVGDKFYVANMSYAVNCNNEYIGDYLKTFFIDYYHIVINDKITTQHYIWAFTDDFHSWRINQSLVNYIKENPNHYSDDGYIKWNNSHSLYYSFKIFLSEYTHHQNFFAYYFQLVPNNNYTNGSVVNNSSDNYSNYNNIVNNACIKNYTLKKYNYFNQSNKLYQYKTGNPIWLLLCSIFIISFKRKR